MARRFDPELAPFVPLLPDLDVTDATAARATLTAMQAGRPPFTPPPGVTVARRTVPGVGGVEVPVVVFRPDMPGPLPALLYAHGGGYVMHSAETDLASPAGLCAEVGAVVVSVDYRLAPEHRFPAAFDDCWTGLCWLAEHAAELGVDPARIAVGGVSAGAGLAAALALAARDRGGPAVAFQLLDIPVLDDRLDTASMLAFTDTPLWNLANAQQAWSHYLGDSAPSPYASPARAGDLAGLPPAYLAVAEFDPLRDEGIAYAARLMTAGVPVELHAFPGTFHGSAGALPQAGVSRRMRAELVDALRRGLASPTPTGDPR
ncbi:alpha/beta hydrolase [Trujillonella endophytica]|uniref:Acetyl esterase/lipase n=1 Tax=Trujillonella endophytica TaxID=673521 RepID=A0A1H8VWF4_9ACTN|nr:alpha/beta hydrolase [Trujillella endophytica]SEP19654.1 Acetyl esterase/lipase [Trujillella endophytica]